MMTSAEKQLLVSAAVAAANHGLVKHSYNLMALFPQLIADREDRHICSAIIYFILHETEKAESELTLCQSQSAKELTILVKEHEESRLTSRYKR